MFIILDILYINIVTVYIHTHVYYTVKKIASQKPYIEVISWENGNLFVSGEKADLAVNLLLHFCM